MKYYAFLLVAFVAIGPLGLQGQNVGVGTPAPSQRLDINGWIELGDEASSTAPGTAGALRYNSGGFLEYHDGTAWQTVGGTPGWELTGNAGTTPATNFLGTTDAQDLVIRTNNDEQLRVAANGRVRVNTVTNFNAAFTAVENGVAPDAIYGISSNAGAFGVYGENSNTGAGVSGWNIGGGQGVLGVGLGGGAAVAGEDFGVGTGVAGFFVNGNPANNTPTVIAQQAGTGSGLEVLNTNATSAGTGQFIVHDGLGRGLEVQLPNTANTENGISIFHDGDGRVLNAQNSLATATEMVGFFAQNSTGTAPLATYQNAAAVWGQSDGIRSGVFLASGGSANTQGLTGQYIGATVVDAIGVLGISQPGAGFGVGVQGQGDFIGVAGFGGDFGVVSFGDMVSTGAKPFQIDYPKDPENYFLRHYSIESDEVLNHYRGTVRLDANGEAIVEMEEYFAYVNDETSASYTLTAVGAAMPNLHVKKELSNGQFVIGGGVPGKKVSWVLQTVRDDPYFEHYPERREVVVQKPARFKGTYMMPELYGQPQSKQMLRQEGYGPESLPEAQPGERPQEGHSLQVAPRPEIQQRLQNQN